MNKDFERCCSFLADMIIKYAPEIKEEVEVCMMIKDSIDDEKVSRQKQFDRFCYYLGGVKQLLDEKAVYAASILQIYAVGCIHILRDFIHKSGVFLFYSFILEKVLVEQRLE
jgi:hypothetical protein